MSLILACPWMPRGELARFERYYERLTPIYDGVVVGVSSPDETTVIEALERRALPYAFYEGFSGRATVLELALKQGASHIHYMDMDRLIRYVELYPDALADLARRVQTVDTLIIGRTQSAYDTHPRSLSLTEALPNRVFSHYFGRPEMDFCAGSRGLSRACAEFVLRHTPDHNALWMDCGWAVMAQRGGFSWDYCAVDGLDWETADRFQDRASTPDEQRELAETLDGLADGWEGRVGIALKILELGYQAVEMELTS